MDNRLILVGDGWGAIASYKGLIKFAHTVHVITNDQDLKSIARNILDCDISDLHNEIIIFDGYKPIVPSSVLEKNTCINIHHSLLPKYRGFHSTVWAILNNEHELGYTIHQMSEYIDDGPIIYQYSINNDFKKTSTEYMMLMNDHKANNLGDVINQYLTGKIDLKFNDKSIASWVGKRTYKDCMIDFSCSIDYLKSFFRALVHPYPLPYFTYKGTTYIVTKVDYYYCPIQTHIGRILNIDSDGLWVKVQDGYIIIKEITDSQFNSLPLNIFKIGQYLNT